MGIGDPKYTDLSLQSSDRELFGGDFIEKEEIQSKAGLVDLLGTIAARDFALFRLATLVAFRNSFRFDFARKVRERNGT